MPTDLKLNLLPAVQSALTFIRQQRGRHPKQWAALLAVVLLGGAGGTYAVATAVTTLAPDAAKLPVKEVIEQIETLSVKHQQDMLDLNTIQLFRSDTTRANDTAETLLKRLGINDPAAAAFLRTDSNASQTLLGRIGRSVTVQTQGANTLSGLYARWSPEDDGKFKRLVIERQGSEFVSKIET